VKFSEEKKRKEKKKKKIKKRQLFRATILGGRSADFELKRAVVSALKTREGCKQSSLPLGSLRLNPRYDSVCFALNRVDDNH